MSGSDKMEVDDGPPPVVVVDQGQDAKTPGSEEKKKWRGQIHKFRNPHPNPNSQKCTPPIPIHKKRNKKFAAHRQHNATSARHITQLFQLGRLGVRSHNFCEVVTSAWGVIIIHPCAGFMGCLIGYLCFSSDLH